MSIIGEGINPTISNQIKTRQKVYGSINRTPEQIEYLNSRTAWCKLISSVNITDDFNPASTELKSILGRIKGNNLAKDFVLFNGTQDADTNKGRAGLARNGSYINSSAYGLGGLEFGARPMPGITKMATKTENRGSLRTTVITIKAWNRLQFEIIDILYLRLGYSVLVEFGSFPYFQNDETLIKGKPWSLEDSFLAGKYTVSTILARIQEARLNSNGNYDAVYGKVVNFSWEFTADGSYDITVTIRSVGDVIESLKLNVLVNDTDLEYTAPKPPDSGLTEAEKELARQQAAVAGKIIPGVEQLVETEIQKLEVDPDQSEEDTIESFKDAHQLGRLFYLAKSSLTASTNPIRGGTKVAYSNIFNGIPGMSGKAHLLQQEWLVSVDGPSYYIRLGSLLAYIENYITPKYKTGANQEPILKFDYSDTNYIYTAPNQISADPSICLLSTSRTNNDVTTQFAIGAEPYTKTLSVGSSNVTVGQVMNIYVNCKFILQAMESNIDDKGKVSLISFLKEILSSISKAIGGINILEPFVDDTTNTVTITDQCTLPEKYAVMAALGLSDPNSTAIIDLYGYYNRAGEGSSAGFVKEFGIKTEITPDLATMLSIGAQAAGSVVGEDATGFSKLNQGLVDRVKNEINDAVNTAADSKQSKLQELETKFPNALDDYNTAISTLGVVSEEISPAYVPGTSTDYSQTQINFFQYTNAKKAIETNTSSNTVGLIPVSLNLKFDGLSGLKIYNAIRVDTSYLPSNYPTSMDFIITGLNHTVENNLWTTEITTNMVPRDPSAGYGISGGTSRPPQGGGGGGGTPPPPPRGESRGRWPYYSDSDSVPADIEAPSKGTAPVSTLKVSFSSEMKTKYIPTINTITGYSRGLKLLATTMAQKEGFYDGTRSYRTNNPGNIGNTDSGANNSFKTLKDGITGQLNYLNKVATGGHSAYPVGKNKDIKPYYSPEIDKNQKSYQLTPYLPGYKFTPYTGTLEQFVKIYATGARGGNSYLSTIMSFFKKNGITVTPKTTLAEIAKIGGEGKITA